MLDYLENMGNQSQITKNSLSILKWSVIATNKEKPGIIHRIKNKDTVKHEGIEITSYLLWFKKLILMEGSD